MKKRLKKSLSAYLYMNLHGCLSFSASITSQTVVQYSSAVYIGGWFFVIMETAYCAVHKLGTIGREDGYTLLSSVA